MDLGVSRTIDHAVYTLLNAIAIILWRIDSAIISMSLFSYNTQDWLTHPVGGGVWQVMDIISGPSGFLGLQAWQLMLTLAIMLYGFFRVARPFINIRIVDLGRLLMFGVFSFVVISSGSTLMIAVEAWRSELGTYMYDKMGSSGSVSIDMPGVTTSDEPLNSPQDLDGRSPIRGWEAVSTSYFLVQNEAELNSNIPPKAFREAYCLYDPNEAIGDQTVTNQEGCSPEKAWDEWDQITFTLPITQIWGIPLPVDTSLDTPIYQEHPENRELAIRQVQAGVSRLALGPIVALYPMIEANISLMLALSASIVYLTLPIVMLFSFFLPTESVTTRLLMRFLTIIINTIILNGIIALFLLLLINVSVNGSLSAYLGLVGVAVLGGFILAKVAAGTLRETLSLAMSSVGGLWMTGTTTLMGKEAAPAARGMLGTAKLVGAGAALGAAGMGAVDLLGGGKQAAQSGVRDMESTSPESVGYMRKKAGQLPGPLAKLAQSGLDTREVADTEPTHFTSPPGTSYSPSSGRSGSKGYNTPVTTPSFGRGEMATGGAMLAAAQRQTTQPQNGHYQIAGSQGQAGHGSSGTQSPQDVSGRYTQDERLAVGQAARQVAAEDSGRYRQGDGAFTPEGMQAVMDRLDDRVGRVFKSQSGQQDLSALMTAQQSSPQARGWGAPEARQGRVNDWVNQAYQTEEAGRGSQRVNEAGQGLFGEQLAQNAEQAVARRSEAETRQVLDAARQVAASRPPEAMLQADGRLTETGLQAVQAELDPQTRQAFKGRQGEQDLATLTAMAMQPEATASPAAFRQAAAEARGEGERAPGRAVPQALGLDPVAAGPHYAGLNRFAQTSEQAGLSEAQRHQLLDEIKQQGQVSNDLQGQIQASLDRQAGTGRTSGLTVDDVVASAQALPDTLSGPREVRLDPASWPASEALATTSSTLAAPQAQFTADQNGRAAEPVSSPGDEGRLNDRMAAAAGVAAAGAAATAASAAVEAGARERLSERQEQAENVSPASGIVTELRNPAEGPAGVTAGAQPQQVEIVGSDRVDEAGSPAAVRPALSKYEAVPQTEAPATATDETLAEGGSGYLTDPGSVSPVTPPGESDEGGLETAGIAAELRQSGEEGADEELPDLRAAALKQMAEEAKAREEQQGSEGGASSGQEQRPDITFEQAEGQPQAETLPASPSGAVEMAGAAGTGMIAGGGEETGPDAGEEARQLTAELRNQVKVKDAADEREAVMETREPGAAAELKTSETEAGPEKDSAEAFAVEEARAKLGNVGQQPRTEAGEQLPGGPSGVVTELRRGRVDGDREASNPTGEKKTKQDDSVVGVLGENEVMSGNTGSVEQVAGSQSQMEAEPAAKTVSMMPHRQYVPEPAKESGRAKQTAQNEVSEAPAKTAGQTEPATKAEPPDAPANTGDQTKPATNKEKTPAETVQKRPEVSPKPGQQATSGNGSTKPDGAQVGRATGKGPVPESLTGGGRRAPAKKQRKKPDVSPITGTQGKQAGREGKPAVKRESETPPASKEKGTENRQADKRPPLKR